MAVSERDPHSGHMTTGHDWNGIKELNTPVPKAVWFFLIVTAIFSVGYWVLMPAWPTGQNYTRGLLGNDQRQIVSKEVRDSAAARSRWTADIAAKSYDQIRANPELMGYVRADGHRLFGDNCAACHGTEATGNPGFPNLLDKSWIWGGTADDIAHSIAVGVNSPAHKATRVSQMLAFGKDGILDADTTRSAADFVKSLSDPSWAKSRTASIAKGRAAFAANCVICHGPQGRGNPALGAPDLTDQSWIYGGDFATIYQTINDGRQGEMPAWENRLSLVDRKILTVYLLDKAATR